MGGTGGGARSDAASGGVIISDARAGDRAAPSDGVRDVDEACVSAASRGDHRAFVAIVEHYDQGLRALAYHVLGGGDDLDDVLQEVYVKAYRGLPSFSGASALGTWLYRITYTTCLNLLRSRRRHPSDPIPDLPEPADHRADPAARLSESDAFARLLGELPVDQRAALVLVDGHGLRYADAAAVLRVPVGTLASRVAAGRARLRRALSPGPAAVAEEAP